MKGFCVCSAPLKSLFCPERVNLLAIEASQIWRKFVGSSIKVIDDLAGRFLSTKDKVVEGNSPWERGGGGEKLNRIKSLFIALQWSAEKDTGHR